MLNATEIIEAVKLYQDMEVHFRKLHADEIERLVNPKEHCRPLYESEDLQKAMQVGEDCRDDEFKYGIQQFREKKSVVR